MFATMAMGMTGMGFGAPSDLSLGYGMGDALNQQRNDMTEEERRRRKLGISADGQMNFGMTGVASVDLGLRSAGR